MTTIDTKIAQNEARIEEIKKEISQSSVEVPIDHEDDHFIFRRMRDWQESQRKITSLHEEYKKIFTENLKLKTQKEKSRLESIIDLSRQVQIESKVIGFRLKHDVFFRLMNLYTKNPEIIKPSIDSYVKKNPDVASTLNNPPGIKPDYSKIVQDTYRKLGDFSRIYEPPKKKTREDIQSQARRFRGKHELFFGMALEYTTFKRAPRKVLNKYIKSNPGLKRTIEKAKKVDDIEKLIRNYEPDVKATYRIVHSFSKTYNPGITSYLCSRFRRLKNKLKSYF